LIEIKGVYLEVLPSSKLTGWTDEEFDETLKTNFFTQMS
jgi:hypothetical protein